MHKLLILLFIIILCSFTYALPYSVETIYTNADGTAHIGTFTANFTCINSSNNVFFTNTSTITTDVLGRFYKEFDMPPTYNETNISCKWKIGTEDSGYKRIGFVKNAENSQYLQGKDLMYFAPNSSLSGYLKIADASAIIDNDSIIRVYNVSWAYSSVNDTNITFQNLNVTSNLTVSDTGFFTKIGQWYNRVTEGWFDFLSANRLNTTNATIQNLTVGFIVGYSNTTESDSRYLYLSGSNANQGIDIGAYSLNATNLYADNEIYTAYLRDNFGVGIWDMTGDPWYFSGADIEFANDFKLDGYVLSNLTPATSLLYYLGTGANRWKYLYVQNISAEDIDAYNVHVLYNLTTDGYVNGVNISNLDSRYVFKSGDNMTYLNVNGNVGIGTTTPTNLLELGTGNLKLSGGSSSRLFFGATSDLYDAGANYLWSDNIKVFHMDNALSRIEIAGTGVNNYIMGNVGIGTTSPSYPLTVSTNVSSISIYSEANISAAGYITRTEVYDKSQGNALDKIKDASVYLNPNGTINHNAFSYSGIKYDKQVIDYYTYENYTVNECNGVKIIPARNETICNDIDVFDNETNSTVKKESCIINEIPETTEKICGNVTKTREIPTYKVIQEEGVSLDKEVALLKQALFELKEENIKLTERLNKLEGK